MTVILVIHILVSLVLVGVVLMQRSEGGALGIGGGGGGGGLMSGRGAAGALVRTTIIFGGIFFVTSLVLTTIATRHLGDTRTEIERQLDEEFNTTPGGDPLDVINDPTAPLLDDSSALDPAPAPSEDPLAADPAVADPLATEQPPEEPASDSADAPSEEAVDEGQPQ
ncbi:MAG: preprotein translocase subunit SecG [Henriciella sp.]|uniref:preprotein translocase subunit SecG n=1 Tax=Henriciella sp. TaxID=1968823 RepID=UPI003C706D5F